MTRSEPSHNTKLRVTKLCRLFWREMEIIGCAYQGVLIVVVRNCKLNGYSCCWKLALLSALLFSRSGEAAYSHFAGALVNQDKPYLRDL